MSPRDNSNVRKKPAVKKKKSAWELHRDTIIRLYKDKTLEEVMAEMEESFGFRANKRQYVYRLSEWKARKYNSPPPETDKSQISGVIGLEASIINHDTKPAPSVSFLGQAPQSNPAHDVAPTDVDSTDQDEHDEQDTFSMEWLMKMKAWRDALLVLPRNWHAFDDYKTLHHFMPEIYKSGIGYRAIIDACVFSALADKVDPQRKDRRKMAHAILAGITDYSYTGGLDKLRRRLQLHALQIPIEGGPDRTMNMMEDIGLVIEDPNMFLLVSLFWPGFAPTAVDEERIMDSYVQRVQKGQGTLKTLLMGIEWCKSICNDVALEPHGFNIHCSNLNERVQLGMAKVSCLLFTKLLSPTEELPFWAQDIDETLGISMTTFAVALVCMAWDHSERCSSPGLEFTPYQRVCHGLNMLSTIQPLIIWRMFLRAFVQVHKVAFIGHIHTFPSTATDQSPCSEGFIKRLDEAVSSLIGHCQPSEFSETTSVSDDPFTPSSTQDSYYSPEMELFSPLNEDFDDFCSGFNTTHTFGNGKGLADYLQLDASQEICSE